MSLANEDMFEENMQRLQRLDERLQEVEKSMWTKDETKAFVGQMNAGALNQKYQDLDEYVRALNTRLNDVAHALATIDNRISQ